jgi:hypothetical protein
MTYEERKLLVAIAKALSNVVGSLSRLDSKGALRLCDSQESLGAALLAIAEENVARRGQKEKTQ